MHDESHQYRYKGQTNKSNIIINIADAWVNLNSTFSIFTHMLPHNKQKVVKDIGMAMYAKQHALTVTKIYRLLGLNANSYIQNFEVFIIS